MKQIVRKDGITYERKEKIVHNDRNLNIRISSELYNKAVDESKKQNMKFAEFVRYCIEKEIK